MNKIGRPKSENPKRNMIGVRMTDEEFEELKKMSEKTHMSIPDTIRQIIKTYTKGE